VSLSSYGARFASLIFLSLLSTSSWATISYQVSIAHPEQHLFHVSVTIPDVRGVATIQMPAWNALYQIRDFSHHVRQMEAFAGNPSADSGTFARVSPVETDKQTWRLAAHGDIFVTYTVYWDEAGPFASQLNAEHAFINPAMILVYLPERRSEEQVLTVVDVPADWHGVSALSPYDAEFGRNHNVTVHAASYDALADAPLEVGKFQEFALPGILPPVSVVVHGEGWNKKKIEEDLGKICRYELKLMGGAPYEHYTFILHIGRGSGGGGMEHANSTAIGVPTDEFLDSVAAHEFFHLWNVKRIRPASLEPVDYAKEQYTRALWFAEGVTSTYDSYTMLRTHLWTKQQFYDDLSQQISELESRPANKWQSAEQSSLDAWLEKYPLYNRPEYSVSYYPKGQVLGVLLDLQIRERTDGAKSLDDVLRLLNDEFAKQGKFYRDSLDIRLAAEKAAGGSFEEFFDRYVAHANPFPYAETLGVAGLELRTIEQRRATLGFAVDRGPDGWVVRSVDVGSSAAAAGLHVGDVIVQLNKQDPPRRLEPWLGGQKPGDEVHLSVRRGDKQYEIVFRLGEAKEVFYQVVEESRAPEKARQIREAWLRGD
jgi:predicted metalloprotease with PDZ domain